MALDEVLKRIDGALYPSTCRRNVVGFCRIPLSPDGKVTEGVAARPIAACQEVSLAACTATEYFVSPDRRAEIESKCVGHCPRVVAVVGS